MTYRVARISVFSAFSVIGSFLHLPSPIQTVALDSAPGFFAALFYGAFDGALVSGIGHLATASINGFPLGILHFPIAFGLAGAGGVIGLVSRMRFTGSFGLGLILGIAINVGLVVLVVPVLGWDWAIAFTPFLIIAATINAAIAALAYGSVKGRLRI